MSVSTYRSLYPGEGIKMPFSWISVVVHDCNSLSASASPFEHDSEEPGASARDVSKVASQGSKSFTGASQPSLTLSCTKLQGREHAPLLSKRLRTNNSPWLQCSGDNRTEVDHRLATCTAGFSRKLLNTADGIPSPGSCVLTGCYAGMHRRIDCESENENFIKLTTILDYLGD